jgi:signal transduction histidine kinase/ActR/RegA family two-component response regulator
MKYRGSLRRKIMVVVMTTTCAALLLSATVLLLYELRSYRASWIEDLATQADLVSSSVGTALAFDDAKTANENLSVLKQRPQIQSAAVYDSSGNLFATYATTPELAGVLPLMPRADGPRFDGAELELFKQVRQNDERVGTVYLRARYDIVTRLADYLTILVGVTLSSLALAALIFNRLQHSVTRPIMAVANVASEVMQQRNYSLRVPKTSDDEVGALVDAFNNMLHDLSIEMAERHRAEEALRLADRRKDEFLATLAHERRNPLAPMANALELLKRADLPPEVGQRARSIMARQLKQMVRLIDDLLEVSRITTGKLGLRKERLDLLAVIRGAIESVEPSMRSRTHVLTSRMPDFPLWIEADAARLTQVFGNLLNNAAKYTDAGGRISVDVTADENRRTVEVRVSDNGMGIDPSMQEAIFEMFMQVDQSLERGRAGLGVGLTLARQLVGLHGGSLKVSSAGLGQGSTFTVSLPLSAEQAPVAAREPALAQEFDEPQDILVADDNVDFANSLGSMLESRGHRVRVVHDGKAALAAASTVLPDVGLFDIGMPGLNGYELARQIRQLPGGRDMILIAITGWGQKGDKDQASDAGFDHHLVKPVELGQVVALLKRLATQERVGA